MAGTKFEIHAITVDGEKLVLVSGRVGWDFHPPGRVPTWRTSIRSDADALLVDVAAAIQLGHYQDMKVEEIDEITQISDKFSDLVKTVAGAKDFRAICIWNMQHFAEGRCASHGWCDSNTLMLTAFKMITGRVLAFNSPDDIALVNEAWDKFRRGTPI